MATFLFTALFLFLMCNDAAANSNSTSDKGLKPTVSLTYALLLILGFGVFAALVALTFDLVRRYVYHDADNLDTAFDAGGKVTMGLTASTIVSQWTWAGALLQASTVATKYGISGPFWYASGATIQIILFAILSIQLKTKAPGAKTFLQVVRARFGKKVHIVYVVFAGFTNLVVTASLLLGGTAVLTGLIQGLSMELAVLVLTVVIGTYTLIGGLGATFYVSYFNTTLIFIMLMILVTEVYHNPFNNPKNPFGSSSEVYRYLNMTIGPDGNEENSYLTFLSSGGLMFGIINIIGNFGTVVCDQSYWQSSVAAKPIHGVWGFISGGLTWFAIPFTMATTMGLAYLAFTAFIGAPLLTPGDVDAGLVPPVIAQRLLGSPGEFIIIILLLQAIMSTGSAEVIAVSSIIIYDIYKVHIKPFRPDTEWYDCENCGKINSSSEKLKDMKGTGYCECPPMVSCTACLQDTLDRKQSKLAVKPHYKCEVHGKYKEYQELLLHKKNWCIVWVTMAIIPIVLLCKVANLNLSWVYLFTGVLIGCAVIPISLSVLWTRVNGYGMVAGVVIGCIAALISWLVLGSTYPGGLGDFITNTGREVPMLVGNCVSIGTGGLICIIVSLVTNRKSPEEREIEWEKTRNIDNPLHPWIQMYADDFVEDGQAGYERPTMKSIRKLFKKARIISYTFGITLSIVLIIVWPLIMIAVRVMDIAEFGHWVRLSESWAFIGGIFIIIVPLVQEIYSICKKIQENKKSLRDGSKPYEYSYSGPNITSESSRPTTGASNPAYDNSVL